MDRLLTGLAVIDCFWFISLLDGKNPIFFLYDFFFFVTKSPKPTKQGARRGKGSSSASQKNTWGHTPLPAASSQIQAIRDDLRPVSSRPHSSVCFSSLLTSFSKSFLDLSSSSKHCFILLFSCKVKNKGIKMQLVHFMQCSTSTHLAACWLRGDEIPGRLNMPACKDKHGLPVVWSAQVDPYTLTNLYKSPSDLEQEESSSWKTDFSLGWRTLFYWGGLSHLQVWGWQEDNVTSSESTRISIPQAPIKRTIKLKKLFTVEGKFHATTQTNCSFPSCWPWSSRDCVVSWVRELNQKKTNAESGSCRVGPASVTLFLGTDQRQWLRTPSLPPKLPASVLWLHLSVHKPCQRGSCKKKCRKINK